MRLDPFPFPTTATGTSPVLPTCLPCNARATGRAGRPPRACRPEPGAWDAARVTLPLPDPHPQTQTRQRRADRSSI